MVVSDKGKLIYVPTPKGAKLTHFQNGDQAGLEVLLKRYMIMEPASFLDTGNLLGYFSH